MKKLSRSGLKAWDEAKQIIPGGNQLLSKRAEMFLPDAWPAYYKKAKGCEVWDLDNQHYYDFSIMGIGTSSLGYSHDEVNESVISSIKNGAMCTLNAIEELQLAKALMNLHPWAGGVRFARAGGEACAIAVRIARAYTQKDQVAFCGYHGWHDWYLATNLEDSNNLNQQLLPGLTPSGVPKDLSNSIHPFKYGDLEGFYKTITKRGNHIGVVIMEPFRHHLPDLNFLRAIISYCKENEIVLIFDEISSGFRLNTGGSHLLWNLEPDICILGKAMGNGHPISAVIGKKKIMNSAQSSFISSSFWSERVGYVAALKTIEIFKRDNVINWTLAKPGDLSRH